MNKLSKTKTSQNYLETFNEEYAQKKFQIVYIQKYIYKKRQKTSQQQSIVQKRNRNLKIKLQIVLIMQKIQKNKDPFMYQIQFKHVKNFKSWPFVYIPMIVLSALLYAVKLYQMIRPGLEAFKEVPYFTVFIVEIFFLAVVVIVGGVSMCVASVNNVFAYLLLFTEALGMLFVETTMQCFEQSQWCQSDVKYQAGAIIVLCLYALIVYVRSSLYYPFYDNFIYISMSSSSIVLFDFVYKLLLGLMTNLSAMDSIQSQRKFLILVTIGLYCVYNGSNYYCNPKIHNCWLVVNTFLAWTTLVIYLLPYLDVISTMAGGYVNNSETLFWYVWGYSTPCLICYIVIANFTIDAKDGWKQLFLEEKHEIKNLDHLYLMASQLKEKLKIAKKSQQKTNDPLFKSIWALVQKHNQFCDHVQCPLSELKNIQIHRNDDFLESKRLGKTIQCCYSFGQYHLQRKKDRFPNLLQLSVQIANYELQVFQNRQKGLVLYTQFYTKQDIDSNQKFMLYYLKKKIQQLFIDNQNYSKSNTQNQISQFRHNIEVSVSMLAEFWYFLADPKCNLKKLYDLANVLFPLKIGVDNEWKNIQKLKNIESYNLYARYLIKVFNDKEKGLKILQEAKKIQLQMKNKQEIEVDAQGNSNIGVEQNGIIFLEFDGKNPGVMYQVNLAAQRIFGYNKGELVNRKVNDIMPKLFANHHDKILENYQQTNKAKMMNKERVVWGKSKDGYMFTFTIMIKPVKNLLSQSSEVYACIKRETWVKESAFLTLDMQDQISEVSATMLGIYPELYGKVNLKKKMHITEIIPNFAELKEKMLEDKESTQELQVHREYQISPTQKFKQTTIFNLSMQDITIEVAGQVGHFLKFQKTVVSNAQKDLALSNIRESRLKQNHFRFIYQILEAQSDEISQNGDQKKAIMKFKGGVVHDIDQMAKSCVNSASRFFTKLPVQQQKKIEQREKIDYSENIKTKRLQGKQIRQIHLISQQSQFDIGQVQKQMQQNLGVGNIKPSQLSSILQKQTSNKHIFCLKLITFCILMVSSILCIIQYVNLWEQHTLMIDSNEKVRKLNELGSEILYMKMYTSQFSSTLRTPEQLALFTAEINLLDEYLDYYSYNTETKLVYNDGSQQNLLLGFALNKLISQANSMKSSPTIYNQASSHVHFVNYNTINGLILSTKVQNALAVSNYNQSLQRIASIEIIYIGLAIGLFVTAMIIKNILLRIVLKKKSQILEVFFEIPRKACTSIQKQCERFIQRLSSENQQELESLSMASEGSQAGFAQEKKQHKQKKRTVMGEQKTTNHYIIATVAFLVILLFFHIFVKVYHVVQKQNLLFTMSASEMIFKLEQQASLTINLMNSYALNQSIPLLQRSLFDSYKVIQEQFNAFSDLYGDLAVKFYLIGNILDDTYLSNYNQLSYENLCTKSGKPDSECNQHYGQNYGLNVVLSQYFNVIKDKYLEIRDFHNSNTFDSTAQQQILQVQRLRSERSVQYLLKQHWRQLTRVTRDGLKRLIKYNDTVMFALMLTMCIANCTILLFCWLRFYHSLEQKIAATQYILTFIPIDEINRNPKIANYIKEEILEKR